MRKMKAVVHAILRAYDHIFLWAIFALIAVAHYFPLANKFDLPDVFSPVLMIIGTIAAGCLFGWLNPISRKNFSGSWQGLLSLLLFALWSALAFLFGDVKTYGFSVLFVEWGGFLAFLYYASCVDPKGRSPLETHLPIFVGLLMALHAAIGTYAYLALDHTRFFGLFFNWFIKADAWPNSFAFFFLLTFPLLTVALWRRSRIAIALPVTGFLLGLFALALSRAATVALLIEIAIGFILYVRQPHWRTGAWKKPFVILGVFLVAWGTFSLIRETKQSISHEKVAVADRFAFQDATAGTSFTERREFYEGSLDLVLKKPFFGTGLSSFKWVYPTVQKGFLALSDHPHNLPLSFAVERGAPTAIFFILFVFSLFFRGNPFRREEPLLIKAVWIGLVGAGLHEMVDHNLNFISNQLLLWLFFALVAWRVESKPNRSKTVAAGLFSLILIIGIFASGFRIVRDSESYRSFIDEQSLMSKIDEFDPLLPRIQFLRLDDQFNSNPEIRKALLAKALNANPYDTEASLRLASILQSEGDMMAAAALYRDAFKRNPKNTFRHYLGFAETGLKNLSAEDRARFSGVVLPLIEEYEALYALNLHYTRRTSEIDHAKRLKQLLVPR